MAGRLCGVPGTGCGDHDLRLLSDPGTRASVDDLYLRAGAYEYARGFNWFALAALGAGAASALVGLVVPALRPLYDYSWFVGFTVSFVAYYALMKLQRQPDLPALEVSP